MPRLHSVALPRLCSGLVPILFIFALVCGCPDNTSPGGQPSNNDDVSQTDAGSDLAAEPSVEDQTVSDAEAEPPLPDVFENQPPAPTAPAIEILKNVDGTSQIEHNDPDVGDSHQYEVTTQPTNGTAVVSDAGVDPPAFPIDRVSHPERDDILQEMAVVEVQESVVGHPVHCIPSAVKHLLFRFRPILGGNAAQFKPASRQALENRV